MLWDLLRDFFVQHIFGGVDSLGSFYGGLLGYFTFTDYADVLDEEVAVTSDTALYNIGTNVFGEHIYISVGDWLSTTATIISISIITILCCLFVYRIIKLIGGLIR